MTTSDEPFDAIAHVAAALSMVAPDVDPDDVDADLHDDLGLDSMDLLNVAAAIAEATGIDIPERDYPGLRTIRAVAGYLESHR